MPKHKQPTKEELKAAEDAAIEEAEKLEHKSDVEAEPEVEEEKPEEKEEEEQAEPVIDPESEEELEAKPPEEEAEPSKELFKKKASASARENQKIYAKNRVINQAIVEANEIPTPTDEEMQGIYGESWELASDIEKESLKETQLSKRWREKIQEASNQATKIEKWNESVLKFVDDPKTLVDNPELEGKTEEFAQFATDETNNSVPFPILVAAFLHNHSVNKQSNKGRMFEKGSGGPNDKPQPKNGKITLEEARRLRETNYEKWKEYNSKGLIDYNL